ncbi:DUF6220 domain-containing protein [Planotetraspora sp. A-T 1434]|uniref:DUF6220 domain-containing protein n=1 Tax=Planotetraspora sp. A-T 1434 TaxID=2979219 RepID=UPI0021C1C4C1|nr:DUF6220 domain-containing protein [Planotetraspora sp. A-T 1434]MCT9933250.1 DUF6220 domain-containing protein [Planotetraspora sp. A-T 1434]
MRRVYAALAGLLLLSVVVQFYFAAVGAFEKPQVDGSFALHSVTGTLVIPVLSLLATVAAALSRAPGRQIALTILPLGLVIVQMLIIALGEALDDSTGNTTPASLAILGLHAVNGLAIMGVSGFVFRGARLLATTTGASPHGD